MSKNPEELKKEYGFEIIHQSWKSERIPLGQMRVNFGTWSSFHPNALHVLWTDEDNLKLVTDLYPEFLETYNILPMNVMRADMARLLYIHRYGGLYVDLDYEAKANVFEKLPNTDAEIFVVESPTLMNEVMQNSLMVSKTLRHPFWYETCKSIVEIQRFLNHPEECKKHGWSGCDSMMMFHSPFTGKAANLILILDISGPAVLDKTWVLHRHKSWDQRWKLELLSLKDFFIGTYARHYQFSTWVNIPYAIKEIIGAVALGVIGAFVAGVTLTYYYLKKQQVNQVKK